jgi:hypothetical protein
MIIDPKADFHGFTMLEARNVVRLFEGAGSEAWCTWRRASGMVKSEKRARALVAALTRAGYLVEGEGPFRRMLQRSSLGNRFAQASARSIKRATADRIVRELVARATALNADDDYGFRVDALIVFGSYLDQTRDRLGDVDVGYIICPRHERGSKEFAEADRRAHKRARAAGRQLASTFEQVFWPDHEFRLALKSGTAGLSLHDARGPDAKLIAAGPHRVVFGAWAAVDVASAAT